MSYARFGENDSDVYVYSNGSSFVCCGCLLADESQYLRSRAAVVEHLNEHVIAGHVVPQRAFDRLQSEMK